MKKKILITAYDLNIGGIEKALVNFLNSFDAKKYDITLILEHKEGPLLNEVINNINIEEYRVSNSTNTIKRKVNNRIKLIKWIAKNKEKYDFAISFATHSRPGALLALNASKNNALWVHLNYYESYNHNINKMNNFFKSINISKFKNVIFVSNENKNDIINHTNLIKGKVWVINNLINADEIIKKSKEAINIKKDNKITFVNVSRHEESQKKLFRILKATKKLKNEGYDFNILMIGYGPDHNSYVNYVNKNNLNNVISFYGKQSNPYPYYKMADAILISSQYEGYPVVFVESMVLNKPIITTAISDYKEVENGYGIVVKNDDNSIYDGMKEFLDNGYKIKKKFDSKKFNNDQIEKLKKVF